MQPWLGPAHDSRKVRPLLGRQLLDLGLDGRGAASTTGACSSAASVAPGLERASPVPPGRSALPRCWPRRGPAWRSGERARAGPDALLGERPWARTGLAASSPAFTRSRRASSPWPPRPALPPALAVFWVRSRRLSTVSKSLRHSSVSTTSWSRCGSIPALDVHDVGVLEAAQDVQHCVDLADVGQELVSQALALRRPAPGRRCPGTQAWHAASASASPAPKAGRAAGPAPAPRPRWARWCRRGSWPPGPRPRTGR
jgi:hypothetical protein